MPEPLNPGHQMCASCWYWHPNGDNPNWCDAAMGYTDPAFSCEDWRDCREPLDPAAGEPAADQDSSPNPSL